MGLGTIGMYLDRDAVDGDENVLNLLALTRDERKDDHKDDTLRTIVNAVAKKSDDKKIAALKAWWAKVKSSSNIDTIHSKAGDDKSDTLGQVIDGLNTDELNTLFSRTAKGGSGGGTDKDEKSDSFFTGKKIAFLSALIGGGIWVYQKYFANEDTNKAVKVS